MEMGPDNNERPCGTLEGSVGPADRGSNDGIRANRPINGPVLPDKSPRGSVKRKKHPTANEIRKIIVDLLVAENSKTQSQQDSERMIEIAARVWRVKPSDITGSSRPTRFILPRFAVCAELRCRKIPLATIAKQIGRKDHATVSNALSQCLDELHVNSVFRAQYRKFLIALHNAGI